MSKQVQTEVAVIGAGFAGLIAALELRRTGRRSFLVLERGNQVGGVWRDTVYPGCACDVPSHLYSIASRPNPDWTTNFAAQAEILQYLKDVVARDGLAEHIRFGAEVTEARFCRASGRWRLSLSGGAIVNARMLILAVGPHSRPYRPALPGVSSFGGSTIHSSQWDHSLNLTAARVAVIGTGASAVQIIPNIAPLVDRMTVFQRSPAWVLPRGERHLSRAERWLFRHVPMTQSIVRGTIYWTMEAIGLGFVGPRVCNRLLGWVALRQLRAVQDPWVRRALTPTDRAGCKRLMVSDDFYPAFNRSNVRLVVEPIAEVVRDGIVTTDGRLHAVDHIIYATGYTVADPDGFLRVVGCDGRELADEWKATGAEAYLGTVVSGYPNMAILLGPNSGLSHSSALHVVESQMTYVIQYLNAIERCGNTECLDVRASVQAFYNHDLQQRLRQMIWNTGCRSWYLNRAGKNTVIFPGLTASYRRRLKRFDHAEYVASTASIDDPHADTVASAAHATE